MSFIIKSNFIGNFKDGDNIVYNLKVLGVLYQKYKISNIYDQKLLSKPIIILIVSVIEAIFHDLFFRISSLTSEHITHIPDELYKKV